MVATGTRIFLPEVPGVGILRQRYPIMPAHSEGSYTMKNLDALQVSYAFHIIPFFFHIVPFFILCQFNAWFEHIYFSFYN